MKLSTVILAAGQGKRMVSQLPKVLHKLGGKSLLEHVITTAQQLEPDMSPIVITGHESKQIHEALSHLTVSWIHQAEQLGTGHAVLQALPLIPEDHTILILYGDVPLIRADSLKQLLDITKQDELGMITAHLNNPAGMGRIIRNSKKAIVRIAEEKDASPEERLIQEINSGIYLVPAKYLKKWLPALKAENVQKEYYLTDIITYAVSENIPIQSIQPNIPEEVYGVNDRNQLATLERFYQLQTAEQLMKQGVTLLDPKRFDLRGSLKIGRDVIIDVNVIFEGNITIGDHCVIGPHCILKDATIANHVEIKACSMLDTVTVGEYASIGPFARLRPDTELAAHTHVGNFVEIKKSRIGYGTKINHLTYIGDSTVGKQVNIGAGTITCNYDGMNKHQTIIGDHAFIGSNTQLVAPVTIGMGATIGAGSTITKDAPADQLTLCRAEQRTISNWQRPKKKAAEKES